MEFIDDISDEFPEEEAVDMTIADVNLRGIYDVTESGSGFTEEYKSEREQESGGEDTADEPPAAELQIAAKVEQEEWQSINSLRERRDPFPVSVGPFVFEEMGITSVEKTVTGNQPDAIELSLSLQEFREVTIQRQSIGEAVGGSTGGEPGGGDGTPGELPEDAGEWDGTTSGEPEYTNIRFDRGISEDNVSDQGDYYQLDVPSGTMGIVHIDDNAMLSNFLIDITSSGAGIMVHAANGEGTGATASDIADDWTIRNIGIRGQQPATPGAQFVPSTTSSALVENVYAGDGEASYPNTSYAQTGFWINPAHSGLTHFRGVFVEGWPDNGMYFSPPADTGGQSGTHAYVENVYARRNSISCVRVATGDTVDNCCLVSSNANTGNHRGLWAYPGSSGINLRDCDFLGTGTPPQSFIVPSDTSVTVENTRWDSDSGGGTINGSNAGTPQERIPEGVPTSAEQAASGG